MDYGRFYRCFTRKHGLFQSRGFRLRQFEAPIGRGQVSPWEWRRLLNCRMRAISRNRERNVGLYNFRGREIDTSSCFFHQRRGTIYTLLGFVCFEYIVHQGLLSAMDVKSSIGLCGSVGSHLWRPF